MECANARELMMLSLDTALPEHESAAFQEHLTACEGCAEEYAQLSRLMCELGRLPTPTPPTGFWDEVRGGVRSRIVPENHARRPRRSLRPVLATAAAVVAIVVVTSLRPEHPSVMKSNAAYVPSQHALAMMHHPYTEPGLTLLAMSEGTVAKHNVRRYETD